MTDAVSIQDRRFLVVEDDLFSRTMVQAMLRDLGAAQVISANDGSAGLDTLALQHNDLDCVVADFMMPNMNGLQLLHALRVGARGIRRDIPLVMLTSRSDHNLVFAAVSLDVNAFILKPISKNDLSTRLSRAMRAPCRVKPVDAYQAALALAANATAPRAESALDPLDSAAGEPLVPTASSAATPMTGAEPRDLEELTPGSVLAQDIEILGATVFIAGTELTSIDISRLRALSDVADLIGPVGAIWVKEHA